MDQPDELLSRAQVAELLGLELDYVRKFLARRGIQEQRGYRRSEVEPLKDYERKQGRRTDLLTPVAAKPTERPDYTLPSKLAAEIAERLREAHKACPDGSCYLAQLWVDDVQEILDIAAELRPVET
jgi:hypothetical protein